MVSLPGKTCVACVLSSVKQEVDMRQIRNCITRYSYPYWWSVPNIGKLACMVPEKNVTEIFLWRRRRRQTTTTPDDARRRIVIPICRHCWTQAGDTTRGSVEPVSLTWFPAPQSHVPMDIHFIKNYFSYLTVAFAKYNCIIIMSYWCFRQIMTALLMLVLQKKFLKFFPKEAHVKTLDPKCSDPIDVWTTFWTNLNPNLQRIIYATFVQNWHSCFRGED